MPTLWAHSAFWANASPSTVADPVPQFVAYPAWQSAVIIGSGFGAAQHWWEQWRSDGRKTTTQEK